MTTTSSSAPSTERGASDVWATGLAAFAAAMLLIMGMFQMLEGLATLADDEFLLSVDGYVYELDLTAWGWVHLVIGAVAALTGVLLVRGASWARGVGIAFAGLSALVNFVFVPYFPLWAILIIALDVAVVWALVTYDWDRS
jgi:hypothetical protein